MSSHNTRRQHNINVATTCYQEQTFVVNSFLTIRTDNTSAAIVVQPYSPLVNNTLLAIRPADDARDRELPGDLFPPIFVRTHGSAWFIHEYSLRYYVIL